jgi:O-antigen/teichoic acid export membrane protein
VAKSSAGMGDSLLLLTAAKVWITALAILAVPMYLRYLGLEAFGVIGFFTALQSAMVVFDFGLSTTLTKKLAQLDDSRSELESARNLMRSAETIYFIVGCSVVVILALSSTAMSSNWSLDAAHGGRNIPLVVLLAASSLAVLWPTALYSAALMGLHEIKSLSFTLALLAAIRTCISVLAAMQTSDIAYFFSAQLFGAAVQIFWLRYLAWRHLLLQGHRPKFSRASLTSTAAFTGDMALIGIFSIVLSQGDKLLLSQLLSLSDFGVYSLAATAAAGLYVLTAPFFSAFYPYFAKLLSNDLKSIGSAYRQSSELMACCVLPLAAVLVVFSYEVLWVWSGDAAVSHRAADVLSLLGTGTAINALLLIPYAYQIAAGKTRLPLLMSSVALLVTMPALWFSAKSYGVIGAASVWFSVNLGLLIVWPYCMHQKILKEHMHWWYWRAVVFPVGTSVALTVLLMHLSPVSMSRAFTALFLVVVVITNFVVLLFFLPKARSSIFGYISVKISR